MSGSPGFINKFLTPVLSSEVGDLEFMTDLDHTEISVRRASSDQSIFDEVLYPDSNGICTVWQLGDLLTEWMKNNGVFYASFIFEEKISQSSFSSIVLLCDRISSGGFPSVKNRPLLSSNVSVVPLWGEFSFFALADSSARKSMSMLVRGMMVDGSVSSVSLTMSPEYIDGVIMHKSISIPELLESANSEIEDDVMQSVLSVYITVGNPPVSSLSAAVYVSNDPDLVGFSFRNCFGCLERIWLHADIVPDISVESELAVIGHMCVKYDLVSSMVFKVEASNISDSEFPRVSQFITSSEIFEISTGRRIMLSDISQVPPRNYDSLGSLKFSFFYEDSSLFI